MHLYVGHGIEMVLWWFVVWVVRTELRAAWALPVHWGHLWPWRWGVLDWRRSAEGCLYCGRSAEGCLDCGAEGALRCGFCAVFSSIGSRTGNCDMDSGTHYIASRHTTTTTSTYYADFIKLRQSLTITPDYVGHKRIFLKVKCRNYVHYATLRAFIVISPHLGKGICFQLVKKLVCCLRGYDLFKIRSRNLVRTI